MKNMRSSENSYDYPPEYTMRCYFDLIKRQIEVVDQGGNNHFITFFKHPKSKYISDDTKLKFELNHPIDDSSNKMRHLFRMAKEFLIESDRMYKWKTYNRFIYMCNHNYTYKNGLRTQYFLTIVVNSIIMVNFQKTDSTNFDGTTDTIKLIIRIQTIIEIVFSGGIGLVSWLLFKYPEAINMNKSRLLNFKDEFVEYKAKSCKKALGEWSFIYIESFFCKRVPQNQLLHFICSLLAVGGAHNVFYTIKLLGIFNLSNTTKYVLQSQTSRLSQVVIAFIVAIILMWNFTVQQAFYFYDDLNYNEFGFQEDLCKDLSECFLGVINFGLRLGGGIGEALTYEPMGSNLYMARWFYDIFFYFCVTIISLNIIFGIIIDTFGMLRDDHFKRRKSFFLSKKIRKGQKVQLLCLWVKQDRV